MKFLADLARRLHESRAQTPQSTKLDASRHAVPDVSSRPASVVPPVVDPAFEEHVSRHEHLLRERAMARIPTPAMARLIREGYGNPAAGVLLDKVIAGQMKLTEACVTLGWRKPTTNHDRLLSAWKHATDEERRRFSYDVVDAWKKGDGT